MFDQLKDMYNLRKQAQEMQKQMESVAVTGASRDGKLKITLNGAQELVSVKCESETTLLDGPTVERMIKEAHADAQKQLKSVLVEKFKGMM